MCGIHLILGSKPVDETRIHKMLAAGHHRGPDQSGGELIDEHIWIGANRLKILDLSDKAAQPMKSGTSKSLMVWNGAIYNHVELRQQLINHGHSFQTHSDTEVLLYWLELHGEKGLHSLNGMFSLIFADTEKKQILVARDPTGQKPLHYWKNDEDWVFSSETTGILAGLESRPEIDTDQFLPYSYYRFPWPNASLFRDIKQVLPGEVITISFRGEIVKRTDIGFPVLSGDNSFDLEATLKKSVLRSFQSDRNAGLVLSGGVDSSLIYALWYEQTGTKLPTFTTHFGEKHEGEFSDLKFTRLLADRYPIQNEAIPISKETLIENWQEYIISLDQPVGDGAGFLTWYICKQIKTQVNVLVSGAGADELFGGYNRHRAFLHYLKNPRLTAAAGKVMAGLGQKTARKFSTSIEADAANTFIQMAALHPIPSAYLKQFSAYYPNEEGDLKSALAFDRQFYLVNDILKIHDNACMAHGIEGRAPYLDWDLIAYAKQLSEKETRRNIGKMKLKALLNARGLDVISKRKKLGFGMPFREWMEDNGFREFIFQPIKEMERIWGSQFPTEMRTLMRKPELLIEANFLLIWNWFVLASWLQKRSL